MHRRVSSQRHSRAPSVEDLLSTELALAGASLLMGLAFPQHVGTFSSRSRPCETRSARGTAQSISTSKCCVAEAAAALGVGGLAHPSGAAGSGFCRESHEVVARGRTRCCLRHVESSRSGSAPRRAVFACSTMPTRRRGDAWWAVPLLDCSWPSSRSHAPQASSASHVGSNDLRHRLSTPTPSAWPASVSFL